MVAYFSSKLTKQMQAAFTAALLVLCLLGTHWLGFSHSISHAQLQSQTCQDSQSSNTLPSLNHSSDACHLFDALALAGFVASQPLAGLFHNDLAFISANLETYLRAQKSIEHYQSRAPPILLA